MLPLGSCTVLLQIAFKKSLVSRLCVRSFCAVIRLNLSHRKRKCFYQLFQKVQWTVGTVFIIHFTDAKLHTLINCRISVRWKYNDSAYISRLSVFLPCILYYTEIRLFRFSSVLSSFILLTARNISVNSTSILFWRSLSHNITMSYGECRLIRSYFLNKAIHFAFQVLWLYIYYILRLRSHCLIGRNIPSVKLLV